MENTKNLWFLAKKAGDTTVCHHPPKAIPIKSLLDRLSSMKPTSIEATSIHRGLVEMVAHSMAESNITIISSASEGSDNEEIPVDEVLQSNKAYRNTRSKGSSIIPKRQSRSRRFSPAKRLIKHFVEHNYHDHAHDPPLALDNESDYIGNQNKEEDTHESVDETRNRRRGGHRGGVAVPFPEKLHYMLSKMEKNETSHIVNWQPHGRCFVVHKPKEFVEEIMPRFFRQTKMTSFQRQLNLYGFARLTTGPDRGGYYHELFIRGRMDLCKTMTRTRVKGNGSKAASSPATEPNFYAMEPCLEDEEAPRMDIVMLDSSNADSKSAKKKAEVSTSTPPATQNDNCTVQLRQLTLLPIEDHDDDDALLFASPDEEIVLKLIEEGPGSSGVARSESWISLSPASPAALNTTPGSPIAHSISTSSSLPAIVSPPDLPKPLVSPTRSPGSDLFAPLMIGTTRMPSCYDELDDMYDQNEFLRESEGLHSGDEVFFEGLPFHYLETKDFEDCLFVVGV